MGPALSIRLLGALELRYGGAALPPFRSARAESLLACLLLHREAPQPRQHLAFRLWPDSAESQARTNLRHVLHDLRRALPDPDRFLDVATRTVGWRADAPVRLDVSDFETAAAAVDRSANRGPADEAIVADLARAVELYRGDLLEACYDEWIAEPRERLRRRYVAALARLVELLDARGRAAEAIAAAERLIRAEPLREDTYRLLMRLHDARGDRAAGIDAYRRCVATLDREVGVAPAPETRRVYEGLLRPEGPRGGGEPAAARAGADAAPLIGRGSEWTRVTTLWRTVEAGGAGFLLVGGEAGVGKTRLVEEFRGWCAGRGALSADARSYAVEGALAYAPLIAWLRAADVARRLDAVPAAALAELGRILPELRARRPELAPAEPLPGNEQRQRLFEAAAGALSSLGRPILLILDDVHWCDPETLRFVHYLIRTAAAAPVLVAATARLEALPDSRPLVELLDALRSLGRLTEVGLEPLTREATADLASALADCAVTPAEAEPLFRETGGNALFVVEAMRAGWRPDAPGACVLSAKVQTVIASRLAQRSESARELAGAAAALGRDFTAELLARAADLPADAVARGLDELWRTRVLREHGEGVYDFSHDRIREVAYLALSPPRRRQLHRRAAEALAGDRARDVDAIAGEVAAHYDRAGAVEQAIVWYETAARAADRVYAAAEAMRLLSRALELLRSTPRSPERLAREMAILTSMLSPAGSAGGYAARRLKEIHDRIGELAAELGAEPPAQLLRSRAISSLACDDLAAARAYGERLRARASADLDDGLLVESEYVLGIAAFWNGDFAAARGHFERAVGGYRGERRRAHLVRYGLDPQVLCLSRLGNTLWFLGDDDAALRTRAAALALGAEVGHEPSRRIALVFGALLSLELGDVDRLREEVAELESGDPEHDMRPNRVMAHVYRAYLDVLDGRAETGIGVLRTTLDGLVGGSHAPGQRGCVARVLLAAYDATRDAHGRLETADRLLGMGGAATLWQAEAHRARAESLARLGAGPEAVVATLERALDAARRQGAVALERRADRVLRRYRPGGWSASTASA